MGVSGKKKKLTTQQDTLLINQVQLRIEKGSLYPCSLTTGTKN